MKTVNIIDAVRLPIGRYGGIYANVPVDQLGAAAVQALLKRQPTVTIDAVILGNVVGGGGNVARRVALAAGLAVTIPALTVDQQCASGLTSIALAWEKIASGAADCVLCGGVESTSQAPWQIKRPSRLYGQSPVIPTRPPLSAGNYPDLDMGVATEQLAQRLQISRQAQDQYAFTSQQRYARAQQQGRFATEISPFQHFTQDECPRPNTTLAGLAQLPPAFSPTGSLTAGNSCPLNDGAGLVLLASADYCRQHHLTTAFQVLGSTSVGVAPADFALGPVPAVARLMQHLQLTWADIDQVELNEAFAAQALACLQQGHWPVEKVNPDGGALAFGHPFGATGGILVRRLMTDLQQLPAAQIGLVAMCVGGGQGAALAVRKC